MRSNKEKFLSLFYINTCSLSNNNDEIQHLLTNFNKSFDVIALTKTRIKNNVSLTNNLFLNNYSLEFTPTES